MVKARKVMKYSRYINYAINIPQMIKMEALKVHLCSYFIGVL